MTYRLVALDLDGTLLDQSLRYDQADAAALQACLRRGIHVVAATGRPFPAALPWVERLGLVAPFICYQGAQVRDRSGTVLLDRGVERQLALEVIRICRSRDLEVHVYREDRLLTERDRPEARAYAEHSGMPLHVVEDLEQSMGEKTPKVVSVSDPETAGGLVEEFGRRFAGRLTVATSLPTYLEMTAAGADKGSALAFLAERLGVEAGSALAVGDGLNDAPMLAWAGLGVAVEGSSPELLALAGRTIPPPPSGAVARLLAELGLGAEPKPVQLS